MLSPEIMARLACRGILEMPNDPFKAMQNIKLDKTLPSKMKAADRERARKAIFYDAFLVEEYRNA